MGKKFDFNGILTQNNQIKELPLDILVPYHNHMFKVYTGERLEDMTESISKNGVLNPIIVQPIDNGQKYEILSGHNRVNASKLVGLKFIPAVVKENLSEDEAEIYVIETNLMQRGFSDLLVSEQATVLQSRHSQIFSESKRHDIIRELQCIEHGENYSPLENDKKTALEQVGDEYGMSRPTVARLIRVNFLVQELKDMLDVKQLALRVGVELSYLDKDTQFDIYSISNAYSKNIDMKMSKILRNFCQDNPNPSRVMLEDIILKRKDFSNTRYTDNKTVKISIDKDLYYQFFNEKMSKDEVIDIIHKALEKYYYSEESEE